MTTRLELVIGCAMWITAFVVAWAIGVAKYVVAAFLIGFAYAAWCRYYKGEA